MTKVHPKVSQAESTSPQPHIIHVSGDDGKGDKTILTVWKKSLLFNGNGFTVFGSKGNLVFRVDNYTSGNRREIVLMDAVGRSVLSLRRKRLSLGETWKIYAGEESRNPVFCVRKRVNFLQSRVLAHVVSCRRGEGDENWEYVVEGSCSDRFTVYDGNRRTVAEITRKETAVGVKFGNDILRLVVDGTERDSAFAMAIIMSLEQMYGSRN